MRILIIEDKINLCDTITEGSVLDHNPISIKIGEDYFFNKEVKSNA